MWQQILQRLVAMRQLGGVSFWLTEDGYEITAVVLTQEKGIVKIQQSIAGVSWEEAVRQLAALKLPLALHIDGRGLLHKTVEKKDGQTNQDLLNQVIPNAKVQDFTLQVVEGPHMHVSIIRREALQRIRDVLSEKGLDVVSIFLGPFVASRLQYVAAQPIDSIFVKGWSLRLNDASVSSVSPERGTSAEPLALKGGEYLAATVQVPYAAAISTLIFRNEEDFRLLSDDIPALREDWEQKQFFHRSLRAVLGFVFGLLLINVFLFVQATGRNEELAEQLQLHQKTLQRLEALREEVKHKKAFIAQTAWGDVPRAAFYADRLAATLPEQIILTEITVHPLDEKTLKDERKHMFKNKVVEIRGKCDKPQLVNEWIGSLGEAGWIAHIRDQEYEYSSRERTGRFVFTILLNQSIE